MIDRLTAMIPAHNDDWCLWHTLRAAAPVFDEVLVFDDGSTDATVDVVLDARCRYGNHISLHGRHDGVQVGWVEARNRMLDLTDSAWLFWFDADDVLDPGIDAAWLRWAATNKKPIIMRVVELWGDIWHTTQRVTNADRCKLFVNRRAVTNFRWKGRGFDKPSWQGPRARATKEPWFWHLKGVKSDRRLVERSYFVRWFAAGCPGKLSTWAGIDLMDDAEIHRRALHKLLHSRQDRIQRLPEDLVPGVPALLGQEPRFSLTYERGQIVDRTDSQPRWSDRWVEEAAYE